MPQISAYFHRDTMYSFEVRNTRLADKQFQKRLLTHAHCNVTLNKIIIKYKLRNYTQAKACYNWLHFSIVRETNTNKTIIMKWMTIIFESCRSKRGGSMRNKI